MKQNLSKFQQCRPSNSHGLGCLLTVRFCLEISRWTRKPWNCERIPQSMKEYRIISVHNNRINQTYLWENLGTMSVPVKQAYCGLRNEMGRNETKWKSVVCEMKIYSLRKLDFWRSCKRKNNRGKLSPRSPFRNSCKGCYEVVWSRQLLLLN